MFFQIKSYVNFLWNSKNEHGVHSPFVFLLLTKCWYDKQEKPEYSILKKFRTELENNKTKIKVSDFGVGSRVFKSNIREVAAVAKNAGISKKRAELLFRITVYFHPKNILEIGTSVGLATSAMALANSSSSIISLEGCLETSNVARKAFRNFDLKNINCITTEFSNYFESLPKKQSFDMIYFDGNHSESATMAYFEKLLPTIHNDTVWIFDDIHWSKDMENAWKRIQKHPKVTVTIDSYQWGFVFFRKEQVKEHFILRT